MSEVLSEGCFRIAPCVLPAFAMATLRLRRSLLACDGERGIQRRQEQKARS